MTAQASAAPPSDIVVRLVDHLDSKGVDYCHWKSNLAIDRSASGENDLDLLVEPLHAPLFREILAETGFTRVYTRGSEVPGTESFYRFDEEAGRWLNVHAHYRLVLGHDRSKNYRLPIERAYLAASTREGLFRLPPIELEYVVLVVRLVLKYAIWDEIAWMALRGRASRPKASEQAELDDLRARVDRRRVEQHLAVDVPMLDWPLFTACEHALGPDATRRERMATAARLERRLQSHARHSRVVDAGLRVARRVDVTVRYRIRRPHRARFATGGALIALIGGDGSGKTTAIESLTSWLSPTFDVRQVHLGKPRWSPTTYAVRAMLKVGIAGWRAGARVTHSKHLAAIAAAAEARRPIVWYACTARDRRRVYRRANRGVLRGGLVISDRFPHEKLELMDVPQIDRLTDPDRRSAITRLLARVERDAHDAIGPADMLVVLRLDPEVAVRRKVEETPESVRTRGREIWTADWSDTEAHVIDASQPREVVARQLRTLLWQRLA